MASQSWDCLTIKLSVKIKLELVFFSSVLPKFDFYEFNALLIERTKGQNKVHLQLGAYDSVNTENPRSLTTQKSSILLSFRDFFKLVVLNVVFVLSEIITYE